MKCFSEDEPNVIDGHVYWNKPTLPPGVDASNVSHLKTPPD